MMMIWNADDGDKLLHYDDNDGNNDNNKINNVDDSDNPSSILRVVNKLQYLQCV